MKTTAIFSAALLGASILAQGAFAQANIPASETQIENQNAQERDAVADNPGTGSAEVAQPESETIVPGSETQRENLRADERDSVAAGEDAVTTGAMTNDAPTAGEPIVPGSGATFSPGEAPKSQAGEALQDEATTDAVTN
ncbi:hypothetical protein [Jiella pacifica]|uniref:Uncharacterized protein n=1 Tax=Jiella pacifica TaxID=2696469 RepID=A0A6N9SZS9_9HYPH|nr:hypothetical protein [Jiella pacifica]NDW04594.1 hypothetical protein [Jiella pacifica]